MCSSYFHETWWKEGEKRLEILESAGYPAAVWQADEKIRGYALHEEPVQELSIDDATISVATSIVN